MTLIAKHLLHVGKGTVLAEALEKISDGSFDWNDFPSLVDDEHSVFTIKFNQHQVSIDTYNKEVLTRIQSFIVFRFVFDDLSYVVFILINYYYHSLDCKSLGSIDYYARQRGNYNAHRYTQNS